MKWFRASDLAKSGGDNEDSCGMNMIGETPEVED
ncbi:hypothetical protein HBHAL_1075 [Halobacillus halophilus DSM 2266]|uniref:Uncharacterized protein n=1 Tax=Halobacillus halophilus (strain ATCC 35676 / DSM 2266 / JCM 20832 / KCTC 3685 / LMG 17431 / NBRC 102448 / NCIMB 2269) TaxID=866895 RepID=I0JH41_HALH3|nr:hypothetical protein HBHAL_1075 [Halobacillus halophilus DSM 2266]